VEVQLCKRCGLHWVKFTVEKLSGDDWKEISGQTDQRFTEQLVNINECTIRWV